MPQETITTEYSMAATRSDLSIGNIHFLYRNSSFPVQNGFKYQFCTGLALFRYKSIDSSSEKSTSVSLKTRKVT